VLNEASGRIAFRFHARRRSRPVLTGGHGGPVPRAVDGEAPGAAHGLDVDEEGRGTGPAAALSAGARARVDHGPHVGDRVPRYGVEAYVFTFG
jgi:hypothetical protein